jgi:hypothetical protein
MNKFTFTGLIIILLMLLLTKPVFASPVIGGFFSDKNTVADNTLSASTLFFSITDSANQPLSVPYFDLLNASPEASQTKVIRVVKGGIEDFKYNLTSTKTDGDEKLYKSLKIEAKLNGNSVYDDYLANLTLDPKPIISSSGIDQWEIKVYIPSDVSSDIKDKNCSFDLTFRGWQTGSDGSWGFTDKHSINNIVTMDAWTNPAANPTNASLNPDLNQPAADSSATLNTDPTPTQTTSGS